MKSSRSSARIARTVAAGVAVVALGGLAACGGAASSGSGPGIGSDGGDPAPVAQTHAAGTTVTADDLTQVMKTAMTSASSAHVTLQLSMPTTGSMSADGDIAFDPMAEDLNVSVMGQKMEMRLVGTAVYLQLPGANGQWMKLNLSDFSKLGMSGIAAGIADPMAMIDSFTKYLDKATYVGKETLKGESVDHYQLVIDAAKALPSGIPSGVPGGKIPKTITEDLYVDGQGRLAEAKVAMGSVGALTIDLSDYDEKVDITAPANARDMSSMMGQLSGALGAS